MPFQPPDSGQAEDAWAHNSLGDFIYVPLAWRTGQRHLDTTPGATGDIEDALHELHATYLDLPIPDRLLDLVRRA